MELTLTFSVSILVSASCLPRREKQPLSRVLAATILCHVCEAKNPQTHPETVSQLKSALPSVVSVRYFGQRDVEATTASPTA